ncbi:MAG TPA: serpin family protein [Bacteroidales bacterium]|nr:serpin family protein [Bacteroidales bacterium]HOR59656.1 serpin family protein [Bacteroidales bacterium]HPL05064.1 serpin family protein [Bacteroidales bacterium]
MKKIVFYLIIITFLLFSCKTKKEMKNSSEMSTTGAKIEANQSEKLTNFSFNLYSNLIKAEPQKNYSFSPVSLNLAMGMAYAGAEGKTADDISNVMGFYRDKQYFLLSISEYMDFLDKIAQDSLVEFRLANKIYLEQTYNILPSYQAMIEKYFDGAFKLADFINNAQKEAKNINSWVEKITNNKIKNLIPEGTLSPSTAMVLVNAIYINSDWKYQFKKEKTQKKNFFLSEKEKLETDFMIQKIKKIKYAEINSYKAIEMEYVNSDLSLLFILPDESNIDNISDVVLNGEQYKQICNSLNYEEVHIEIPKFKIESSFNLSQMLKKMGMSSAFSNADFSGISKNNNLQISQVLQKVFFEVDEKGTEAAAATAMIVHTTALIQNPDPTYEFIANRPFFYVLKENKYNTPLFIGQFVKP